MLTISQGMIKLQSDEIQSRFQFINNRLWGKTLPLWLDFHHTSEPLFLGDSMKKKVCKKCGEEKPLTEFWKEKRCKNRYRSWCKVCLVKYNRKYSKKFFEDKPWLKHYRKAKSRCQNTNNDKYRRYGGRGIRFLMSPKDFKRLWLRDKAYLLERPSIHRIDNDKNYIFENCKFVELSENSRLGGLSQ